MNDNEKKYNNKKEFVFSDSEKPDLNKYKDKKSFEFKHSPQLFSTSNDFIGLKRPEFTIKSQPNFKKYDGLNEFHFQEEKLDDKSVPEKILIPDRLKVDEEKELNIFNFKNELMNEQEKENFFCEILIYFNEYRSNLNEILIKIKGNKKIFDSTIDILFERCKIEKDQNKIKQGEIALFTVIRAMFFPLNIKTLIENLVQHTKKTVDFVSKEVNETIDWFYNRRIDLKNISLESFKSLNIDCLINNKEEDVLLISKSNMIDFCRVLIDYIKEKLNVFHNDFDTYIEIVKEKNLNKDIIIEDVVSDNTIKSLLHKSIINNTFQNFLHAKRCALIIALALIKCNNFDSLKNSLIISTGLSYSQIYKDINKYIPFLVKFNPNININKWLKERLSIKYEDCVKTAEASDKGIRFAMTREEFNNAMENRGDIVPSKVYLMWTCLNKGHKWSAVYNTISQGEGCPFCYGNNPISYEDCVKIAEASDKGIRFAMTREEFNNAMENRGDVVLSKVYLMWTCLNEGHKWWTSYNSVFRGSGCPFCYGNNPISYDDCVKTAEASDKGIRFAMTREEFNNAMENRGDNSPNKVYLMWTCLNKGHKWSAVYNTISQGEGCPFCYGNNPISYEDCVKIARESNENIRFAMTREEFNSTMENRGENSPNKVLLKWICLNKNHEWFTRYNTIQQGSGCPNCGERKTVIGSLSHPILECLSIILFKLKGCSIQHETYVNTDSYEFVDLVIERNKNFINNIENSQKILTIPNFITQILVDFTLSLNLNAIIGKCFRNYQSEIKFLTIVLCSKINKNLLHEIQDLIQISKDIGFKDHIKVITFDQYLEFLNLIEPINSWRILSENEKIILQKFSYIIDLISDAFNSDEKLAELIRFSDYYKQQLYFYSI